MGIVFRFLKFSLAALAPACKDFFAGRRFLISLGEIPTSEQEYSPLKLPQENGIFLMILIEIRGRLRIYHPVFAKQSQEMKAGSFEPRAAAHKELDDDSFAHSR